MPNDRKILDDDLSPKLSRKLPVGLLLCIDVFVMFAAAIVGHEQDDPTVPHPIILVTVELTALFSFIAFFALIAIYLRRQMRAKTV